MNRAQGDSGSANATWDFTHIKSSMVLRAAYRGTYMAAVLRKTTVLHLTMIGGGVFKNDIEKIVRRIYEAHLEYAGYYTFSWQFHNQFSI